MNYRRITLRFAAVVALFLTLGAFVSGPFHQPYETRSPDYAIAHESTEAFDELLDGTNLDTDDPVEISDLSPETRRAFYELKAQPVESRYGGHSGWQHTDIDVCFRGMLVCDEYAERPDFRTTESYAPAADGPSISGSVVTHDGELYVAVEVLPTWDVSALLYTVTIVPFAAYGLFIVGFAYHRGESNPLLSLGFTGYGVPLIIWPYVMIYSRIDTNPIGFIVAGLVLGIGCWITVWTTD